MKAVQQVWLIQVLADKWHSLMKDQKRPKQIRWASRGISISWRPSRHRRFPIRFILRTHAKLLQRTMVLKNMVNRRSTTRNCSVRNHPSLKLKIQSSPTNMVTQILSVNRSNTMKMTYQSSSLTQTMGELSKIHFRMQANTLSVLSSTSIRRCNRSEETIWTPANIHQS